MSDDKFLKDLSDQQAQASDPAELVWLSASAGTGKTQVLAARVLRLLMRPGVRPETILCLTFTKAGAAEMAERINNRLAYWVMAKGAEVANDLKALGEEIGPQSVAHARTLFAHVLDARGGGLHIQTIHSFAQSLLGSFPAEAGIAPGFTLIEPREEAAMPVRLLSELAVRAENEGRDAFGDRLRQLGLAHDEERIQKLLMRCAKAPDAMAALPGDEQGLRAFLRRELCGVEDVEGALETQCSDPVPMAQVLREYAELNHAWGTKTGLKQAATIDAWLAKSPADRVAGLFELENAWATKAREVQAGPPKNGECQNLREMLFQWSDTLVRLRQRAAQADDFALLLSVGREFALAYTDAKAAAGVVDYDDLIAKTVALLQTPGIGEWIGYKLDQSTDHILIDEAQDTNDAQWLIIKALADEFFAGSGARGKTHRTLFTVGDYKQAIFGFQGSDPRHFANAQSYFAAKAKRVDRILLDLSLSRSYRSSPVILELVDNVIAELGHAALGLDHAPPLHESHKAAGGAITLMPPVIDTGDDDDASDEAEEGWVPQSARKLATDIAAQVRGWIDSGLWLEKKGRPIEASDILILVRSRGELASLIVARLYEQRVPVAGVDRLRLNVPLAVQDLLACVRFALQPLDDLNLAALLVSPLFGWDQDQLFDAAYGRGDGRALWAHLRQTQSDAVLAPLYDLLNAADFTTPYQFLETILSGGFDGRRKLIGRLGEESRDPIDELLNAALDFEARHPSSLQLFLDWLDRSDVEIKRDATETAIAVRVMTVHGAKGLEAPVVILADATAKPRAAKGGDPLDWLIGEDHRLPVFRPRKEELSDVLLDAAQAVDEAEMREHWRLLYVALTRAGERLVICGALGVQSKGEVHEQSWYAIVDRAMANMGIAAVDGMRTREDDPVNPKQPAKRAADKAGVEPPIWLRAPAPQEARPPRPLSPSSLGRDNVADPPPPPAMRAAAERGRLLHSLFERLPAIEPARRREVGLRWLAGSAGVDAAAARNDLIDAALKVIEHPDFADLFSAHGLAEAPIAGVVGSDVIAGTVDRLVVTDTHVRVVDFKTGRRVPASVDACPVPHLRQMAAYHALLSAIFPDHHVEALLLYTGGPALFTVPDAMIDQYKPGLAGA